MDDQFVVFVPIDRVLNIPFRKVSARPVHFDLTLIVFRCFVTLCEFITNMIILVMRQEAAWPSGGSVAEWRQRGRVWRQRGRVRRQRGRVEAAWPSG